MRTGGPRTRTICCVVIRGNSRASCSRFLEEQPEQPAWCQRLVDDWEMTLGALAAGGDDWLARQLDPWIKHSLFGAALSERGRSWQDLATNRTLYDELALLNQNYHAFANPQSSFVRLEAAGVRDISEPTRAMRG